MRGMLKSLILCCAGITGRAAYAACEAVPPPARPASAPARPVNATDLIELRDVGDPESSTYSVPSPFGVSPDGHRVAFYITRSSLADNAVCRALVLLDLARGGPPVILDEGGDTILAYDSKYGVLVKPGVAQIVTPLWSGDGASIAYLRQDAGVTRAWIVQPDGRSAHPISPSDLDVEQVYWAEDGKGLILAARPRLAALRKAVEDEGRSGWLYDRRIWPVHGPHPQPPDDAPITYSVLDPASGVQRPATPSEIKRVESAPELSETPVAVHEGRRASIILDAPSPYSAQRVRVTAPDATALTCADPNCAGRISTFVWQGDILYYLRREGWNHETTALYRWRPGAPRAQRLWTTGDVLHGCLAAARAWVCTRETSTKPRSVVALDPATGRSRVLLDLNPEFARITLPRVRRLRWKNDLGLETWGDLVLPPGYHPGARVPLVVVQYHSVGFLRGGTGNEYPISLFAQRGVAVLSLERPPMVAALAPELADWTALIAYMQQDWRERRSLLSAVERGIDLAIAQGVADPARIGITGLSDGSTTVSFALVNSRRFAAAASSTCCIEPDMVTTYGGIGWSDFMQQMGYPSAIRPDPAFWAPMSIAQNAGSVTTPLLLQSADSEYLLALQSYEALRELGRPVELYIFPGELHDKIEPVHRAAVFERSLDWFDFWLQDRTSSDPAKAAQYRRWEALRRSRDAARH